jgi:TonB family protein
MELFSFRPKPKHMKIFFHLIGGLLVALVCAFTAGAQSVYFNYYYHLEPVKFDEKFDEQPFIEEPQLGRLNVQYPDSARKNGVQGTVKAKATLGEDGKVTDVVIEQDLSDGVGAAVKTALESLTFRPAAVNGKKVAMILHVDYVITLSYSENDKEVVKPEILEKPQPEYPSKYLADKIKGKVSVQVLFKADGTLKVGSVQSVMPKEFDQAALDAASKIKFQPAVHKKSHQPVTQQMTVEYEFKP